jgi:antirestriction protein ArdC
MPNRDLHEEITRRILEQLENADPERWSPPWFSATAAGVPRNALSDEPYRGVNILNLWTVAHTLGFGSARWATFKQWSELGCPVRRGERAAARIVFYRTIEIEDRDADVEELARRAIPILRHWTVFNADQVEGYEDADAKSVAGPGRAERIAELDRFIEATGAEIVRNRGAACYAPALDRISVPEDELFESTPAKYGVIGHELGHWTGHPSRLDRDLDDRFGTRGYAGEELVAELAAAFLCGEFQVEAEPRRDHARYLAGWAELLREDNKAIFTAAARASDAVAFLHTAAESAAALAA